MVMASIADILDKGYHLLLAKWCLRKCDYVGARPRVYGRPFMLNRGRIHIGDRFQQFNGTVRSELVTQEGGVIDIGNRVFLNYGTSLSAHHRITIGSGCQIASYVCMMDNDYHRAGDLTKPGESAPIVLEDNVWLAVRVIVLKGVTIGCNAVVGAGSVVTKDIPPNCLAAGVPAKVVRRFDTETDA